jgi:hypothetical protein
MVGMPPKTLKGGPSPRSAELRPLAASRMVDNSCAWTKISVREAVRNSKETLDSTTEGIVITNGDILESRGKRGSFQSSIGHAARIRGKVQYWPGKAVSRSKVESDSLLTGQMATTIMYFTTDVVFFVVNED